MFSYRFVFYLAIIATGVTTALFRRRLLSKSQSILAGLLLVTLITEIISRILISEIKNSNPVYHFFSPLEAVALLMILMSLSESEKNKTLIKILFIGVIVFSMINTLFIQTFYEFNSNVDLLKMPAAILSVFLILSERRLSGDGKILSSGIIILIAVFWFNTVSFLFIAFHNHLLSQGISGKTIGNIHYLSNIIYYALFIIALLIPQKRKDSVTIN